MKKANVMINGIVVIVLLILFIKFMGTANMSNPYYEFDFKGHHFICEGSKNGWAGDSDFSDSNFDGCDLSYGSNLIIECNMNTHGYEYRGINCRSTDIDMSRVESFTIVANGKAECSGDGSNPESASVSILGLSAQCQGSGQQFLSNVNGERYGDEFIIHNLNSEVRQSLNDINFALGVTVNHGMAKAKITIDDIILNYETIDEPELPSHDDRNLFQIIWDWIINFLEGLI